MTHKAEKPCDVLVVGGGMAGCAAALAARRAGASVVLAEASGLLGGCTTQCLVQPWQTFHAAPDTPGNQPRQIIHGIAAEFADDLKTLSASPGHVLDPIGFAPTLTPVNTAFIPQYLADKLATESVEVLFERAATWAGASGDKLATITLSPGSLEPFQNLRVRAHAFVDASGCALIPRLLGAEVISPDRPQAWTHIFVLAGVDTSAIVDYVSAHTRDFYIPRDWHSRIKRYFGVSGFFSLVEEARARGEFPCQRDRLLMFAGARPGEVSINTTRVSPPDGYFEMPNIQRMRTAARLRADALQQVHDLTLWLRKNVPGMKRAEVSAVAPQIGVRESYRMRGKYVLRGKDVMEGAKFKDAVTDAFYPIDIHRAEDSSLEAHLLTTPYQIPKRTLISRDYRNLFAAGRCFSCDSTAFASARVTPIAMALGEAAGKMAAESI
jgi:hypothetical protein